MSLEKGSGRPFLYLIQKNSKIKSVHIKKKNSKKFEILKRSVLCVLLVILPEAVERGAGRDEADVDVAGGGEPGGAAGVDLAGAGGEHVRQDARFTAFRIGGAFSACIVQSIFERFDRDRSGRIDAAELRDALLSLGYSVSPTVLDLLVSKFDKTGGKNKAIEYDNFIECCLTVKGLTEKFKEKDTAFSGSATFTYEAFMLTVLPFLIA
uniref:EF-hand domain-containing protein n=1 Tax=Oryza brachyantha TaxID=4533 RepID=J3MBG2_ORYBR